MHWCCVALPSGLTRRAQHAMPQSMLEHQPERSVYEWCNSNHRWPRIDRLMVDHNLIAFAAVRMFSQNEERKNNENRNETENEMLFGSALALSRMQKNQKIRLDRFDIDRCRFLRFSNNQSDSSAVIWFFASRWWEDVLLDPLRTLLHAPTYIPHRKPTIVAIVIEYKKRKDHSPQQTMRTAKSARR